MPPAPFLPRADQSRRRFGNRAGGGRPRESTSAGEGVLRDGRNRRAYRRPPVRLGTVMAPVLASLPLRIASWASSRSDCR
jgi:hypothetical protein